jgi:hypothetical protein
MKKGEYMSKGRDRVYEMFSKIKAEQIPKEIVEIIQGTLALQSGHEC